MSEDAAIETEIVQLLTKVAKLKNLENFEVKPDKNTIRGDGFLGEIFLGSVTDKSTGKITEIAMKKPLPPEKSSPFLIPGSNTAYDGEFAFYDKIFPALREFQKDKCVERPFSSVPPYFFGSAEHGKQVIVMENVKPLGYKLVEKEQLLDEKHIELAFKEYGRFHALSFCLKDQRPEEYKRILEGEREDLFYFFAHKTSTLKLAVTDAVTRCLEYTDKEKDEELFDRLNDYLENGIDYFKNSLEYKGEHSCILHGDCWSNNVMFKYDNQGNPESMCMLDFQAIKTGTPASDLSYFFYSGGSKSMFDRLDHFLKIYYDSFSNFARELGSDPEKLLPWDILKEDWKGYAKFGIFMGLLVAKIKLRPKERIYDYDAPVDKELYKERIRNIVNHGYEIGVL